MSTIALYSVFISFDYTTKSIGIDFYQFWAVGQALSTTNVTNIYSDNSRKSIGQELWQRANQTPGAARYQAAANYRVTLETYSSPFLYMLTGIFSFPDYEHSILFYQIFLLTCGTLGILLLCRIARLSWNISFIALTLFNIWLEPLQSELRVLNVNLIQLLCLGLFGWLHISHKSNKTEFFAGLILGALIMFKPNTVFVAVIITLQLILERRFTSIYRLAAGSIAATIFSVITSSIYFKSTTCWQEWILALYRLPDSIITINQGNFSAYMLLATHLEPPHELVLIGSILSITAIFLWLRHKTHFNNIKPSQTHPQTELLILGLSCLTYLLSARLVWLHYYLLSIPSILGLIASMLTYRTLKNLSGQVSWILFTIANLLIFLHPVNLLFGFTSSSQAAISTISGTLILFILSLTELSTKHNPKT